MVKPNRPDLDFPLNRKEYLKRKGKNCPRCFRTHLQLDNFIRAHGKITLDVICSYCRAEWIEEYDLVDYEMHTETIENRTKP